jgi:predicted permease
LHSPPSGRSRPLDGKRIPDEGRRYRRRRPPLRATLARAFYGTLLFAYPAGFRRVHGEDATDVFVDLVRHARRRGSPALLALALRTVPAVVRGGLEERCAARAAQAITLDPDTGRRGRPWSPDMLATELSQSVRGLLHRPMFALTAVLTLALGLGATTAVFSVVDTVLLRPLPYPDSEDLVVISHPVPAYASGNWPLSQAGYFYFREHADTLQDVGVYSDSNAVTTSPGGPERIVTARVTASLLATLGIEPAIGRPINVEDDVPGAPQVALLSHGFWTRSFGADGNVIGSAILLSGASVEIIGVMPVGFGFPSSEVDVWTPLGLDPAMPPVNSHQYLSIARLREGATLEQAHTQLAALVERFPEEMPTAYGGGFMENSGFHVDASRLLDETVGNLSTLLWIVLAAAALVLIIACANVANLTLLRAEDRRRELAVRGALGASRATLLRLSLGESSVVALAGGLIGIALAWMGVRLLVAAAPAGLARVESIGVRPLALLVALAAVLAVSLVLGIVSALHVGNCMAEQLKSGGRKGSVDPVRMRARNVFVVTQVAMAVLLMVGSGVLLRSFVKLRAVDPGFRADNVLTVRLSVLPTKYPDGETTFRFFEQVTDRLDALQGVTAVGATTGLPLVSRVFDNANGVADLPDGSERTVNIDTRFVGPGYFEALGVRLLEGRTFERRDMEAATPGAIVSRGLAQELWPNESPIGKRVRPLMRDYPWHSVVGVIDDVREVQPDRAPEPTIYFPYTDVNGTRSFTFAIRTQQTPMALLPAVQREVWALDPDVPLAEVAPMADLVAGAISRTTFTLTLVAVAAGMALFLCSVGIYGVIAYSVRQRQFEIGVRMALGAPARQVAEMVIRQTMLLAGTGILIGIGMALAVMRWLQSQLELFEVTATDPATLAVVALGLGLVAALAGALPARRATRVDALVALQGE